MIAREPGSDSKRIETWCVMRLDDNGNEFVIVEGLRLEEAGRIADEYEAKGHKQLYWVRRQ